MSYQKRGTFLYTLDRRRRIRVVGFPHTQDTRGTIQRLRGELKASGKGHILQRIEEAL